MMSDVPLETCRAFKNFGIINSITKLHIVGNSIEFNNYNASQFSMWRTDINLLPIIASKLV